MIEQTATNTPPDKQKFHKTKDILRTSNNAGKNILFEKNIDNLDFYIDYLPVTAHNFERGWVNRYYSGTTAEQCKKYFLRLPPNEQQKYDKSEKYLYKIHKKNPHGYNEKTPYINYLTCYDDGKTVIFYNFVTSRHGLIFEHEIFKISLGVKRIGRG